MSGQSEQREAAGAVRNPTVLLVGVGGLGSVILELLAREPGIGHIVACGRDVERGEARCNLARLAAMAQGFFPSITFVRVDLNDLDRTVETIEREKPDLILSTATLQTWWLTDLLPAAAVIRGAPFGLWLPVHLTLTMKLMRAVRAAGYTRSCLTAPFPDVVNPILGKLGLAPTCGIGNLDEVAPKVQLLAARRLGASPHTVRVFLVAHHALQPVAFGERGGELPPHYLRIEHRERDVTREVEGEALLSAPYPMPSGPAMHVLTAGSSVRLVRALLTDRGELLHAPGPNGLPGGYPVVARQDGVRPAPVPGLTLDEAIGLNERSHPFDGVERIEDDGTAVFTTSLAETAREALGYECIRLHPEEAEERAGELMARFREYAGRFGVVLPA